MEYSLQIFKFVFSINIIMTEQNLVWLYYYVLVCHINNNNNIIIIIIIVGQLLLWLYNIIVPYMLLLEWRLVMVDGHNEHIHCAMCV